MGVAQCQRNEESCHGNHISPILGIIKKLNRGDVGLHIHTKFDFLINIVEMGKGDTFFFIFPIKVTVYCLFHTKNYKKLEWPCMYILGL